MFITLLSTATAAADTVTTATKGTQFVSTLMGMSMGDIVSTVTKNLVTLGIKIAISIVIYLLGRWLIRRVKRLLRRFFERRDIDISLRGFIEHLATFSLTILLVVVIVGIIGIDTTSFVALFASAGLAVGMALSGTLQNFAGGVIVLVLKPYRVGDYIEAQGQTGTVKQILLFNTVLSTVDNKTILIPNGGISTGIINNYTLETVRRVDWNFGVAYGDDYDTAKAVILEMLTSDTRVINEPASPFVALHSLGGSSVNIVVRAWCAKEDYWPLYFDINERVYKTFKDHNLHFPFPQMDVHVSKQ